MAMSACVVYIAGSFHFLCLLSEIFQIFSFRSEIFKSSLSDLLTSRYQCRATSIALPCRGMRFTFLEENIIKRSDILTIIYNEEMMIMRRLMVGENTCKKQVMTDGRWRRQHHIASVKNIRNQIKYIQESRLFSPLTLVTLLYCLFIVSFYKKQLYLEK